MKRDETFRKDVPVGCAGWTIARSTGLSGTMGHTGGVIPKHATPFTACIDSRANRQAMSVAGRDGRRSTGHGDSLINSDDTSTHGHGEGVSWDRRCIRTNIFSSKTPYNFVTTGH